jgi:hypothetical protein
MSDFCPVLWPEEPTPEDQLNCCKCGLDHIAYFLLTVVLKIKNNTSVTITGKP